MCLSYQDTSNTSRQKAPPQLGRSDPKPGLSFLLEQVELEKREQWVPGLIPHSDPAGRS